MLSAGIKCIRIYTLTYENILKNKLDVYNLFSTVFPLISTIYSATLCAVMQKSVFLLTSYI